MYYNNISIFTINFELLTAINLENLQDFIDRLFLKVYVECLIHGNITKNKAIELASIIEKKFV